MANWKGDCSKYGFSPTHREGLYTGQNALNRPTGKEYRSCITGISLAEIGGHAQIFYSLTRGGSPRKIPGKTQGKLINLNKGGYHEKVNFYSRYRSYVCVFCIII